MPRLRREVCSYSLFVCLLKLALEGNRAQPQGQLKPCRMVSMNHESIKRQDYEERHRIINAAKVVFNFKRLVCFFMMLIGYPIDCTITSRPLVRKRIYDY